MDEGKYRSCNAAAGIYGIGGHVTVKDWLQKYGKTHLLGKVVRMETADERLEIRKLKDRVRQLEKALADAHLDLCREKEYGRP